MYKFIIALIIGCTATAFAGQTAEKPVTKPAKVSDVSDERVSVTKLSGVDVTLTVDNVIVLDDVMCDDVPAKAARKAKELDARLASSEPIFLVLNTPGGCIDDGLNMIEVMKRLNRPIHTITLFAASMGFQTVQGLGNRYVVADGTLMSHKARGGFYGEFPGQLDSRYSYYLKRITRLDQQAAARTKGKHNLASYRSLIENEYWCDGKDCIDQGFADKVISAKCDKSLDGNREEVYKLFFMGMAINITLIYDKCPLITGILDYDVSINGNKLFKTKKDTNSWESDNSTGLTQEQMVQLNDKVQQIIKDRTQRKVIKY